MTRSKLATSSITVVVVLGFVVPLLALGSGPVGANHTGDQDVRTYHAAQDDRCVTLSPLGDGQETVSEFYGYDPTYNGNYSSQNTDHLQELQVSQLFVYHGEDGASLVFLHDSLEWSDEGGALSMSISGLPSDGRWAVEDDNYGEDTDDNWVHGDTTSEIDWMWGPGRTDGAAFQGLAHLESGERIQIDPAFSEQSFAYQDRSPTWPYADDNLTWRARNGDGELVPLDENQQVRIGPGTCESTPPEAALTASSTTVTTNESVTFDASGSYDESDIVAYHWDVADDGEGVETTDDAAFSHSYSEPGTHTAAVTVTDEDGQNATATTSVDVTDGTPPVARASVNRTAVDVGDPVEFDGSNSTDTGGITDTRWEFGDGESAQNATTSHAYTTQGTYAAELTVTDAAGNVNQTTVTVTVARDEPVATLTAPGTALPDENVTFDASGSSDPDAIAEYRWDVDDDGTPDRTTTDPTLSWGFAAAGDHPVSVTVVDGDGDTNTTSTAVTVVDTTPTAATSTNATNVTVGSTVSFDASASTNATDYEWEFGDGTTATGETATHIYDEPGTYEATLTAIDADDDSDSNTTTIAVQEDDESDEDESDDEDEGDQDESDDDEDDGEESDDDGGDEDESNDDESDDEENDGEDGDSDESDDGDGSDDGGTDGGDGNTGSSGSSGNSGSTGSSGVTSGNDDSTDSTDVTVERVSEGTIDVRVENAKRGESVSGEVPGGENGSIGLRTVEFTPSTDADSLTVTLRSTTDATPPDGTDAGLFEITVQGDPAVEDVTYQFAVDRSELAGPTPWLRVFADDGTGWTPADHSVVSDDSPTVVSATTPGTERVVLAANRSSLVLDSIEPVGAPTAGESETIEATLTNEGPVPANQSVSLAVDGEIVASRTVELSEKSTETVTFQTTFAAAGDRELSVAGTRQVVSVASPGANIELTDVTVERAQLPPGERLSTVATFENTGSAAGTATANFSVVGDVVAVERTSVAPGETVTLRFNESLDSPGNYTVAVNGEQRAVTVGEPGSQVNGSDGTPVAASADGERGTTGLVVAGLGALVVLAAVLNRLV